MPLENESSYVPPEILDDTDEDTIHARMLNDLPADIDQSEGGFAYDMTRPSAIEKADAMTRLNEIMKIFFPEWSYGEYLDMHARAVGLSRKAAVAAAGTITITGIEGTVIDRGFRVSTPATAISGNVEYETLADAVIPSGGEIDVGVICVIAGSAGNQPQGSVTLMSTPMTGIQSITNESPITGGTEAESDDELRTRIMELDISTESSYVGNNADYKRWALEVDGVGYASVIPEWEGAGTGTVKLIVMDANGDPANETIRNAVYNHIMSPNAPDLRLAPIGAILTVSTADAVNVSIAAEVTIASGYTIEAITDSFKTNLLAYFDELKQAGEQRQSGALRYTRVASVLSETDGVIDFEGLTLNDDTGNITIDVDEYPAIQSITLTEAT